MFADFNVMLDGDRRITRKRRYTSSEIEDFENQYRLTLPALYKHFLHDVGTFLYVDDAYGATFELLNLEQISDWSQQVFYGSNNLFPTILLIASDTSGENFGIIAGSELLQVFDPECPVELWPEEQLASYRFSDWFQLLLNKKLTKTW
ncbi:SMI1/KNR4 family protein [Shewanella sp. C32]|uniref:SMI1/KNR4 family protein n=1 Tax=Shewanella electrica TaxID=515560 RepID=A0ABT2FMF7_9GAMM|nr:SMI1/KNR4 family protein [Shewanella electrica]MCH1926117.1 SMI1/KNR4 family protein [Shewanella electrica]MCS4557514.1 SMI1/KNR4 family protein [Shewanella electrica]